MRVLTLKVRINQPEANWIWDSHLKNKPVYGVIADKISNDGFTDEETKINELEDSVRELETDKNDILDGIEDALDNCADTDSFRDDLKSILASYAR